MEVVFRRILAESLIIKTKLLVGRIGQLVESVGRHDPTLNRIGVDDFGKAMHDHPSTAFLRHFLVPVFGVHVFLSKIAVFIFEPFIVEGDQLAEDLAFHLFDEIVDGIAIDEASLLGVMSVQVEVEGKSVFFVKMCR